MRPLQRPDTPAVFCREGSWVCGNATNHLIKVKLIYGPGEIGHMSCELCSSQPGRPAMRNDSRPVGEKFRDIAEHDDPPSDGNGRRTDAPAEQSGEEHTPFVVN